VVLGQTELIANHIPLLLDSTQGQHGTLRGHVARSNPVWRNFDSPLEALAVFQGPQAYVSPSWYPSKQADGKVVPTWNYAVVHAYGKPQVMEDPQWLHGHLTRLTAEHESGRSEPWHVADAPEDYIQQMMKGVVGIEMRIDRIQGKWKVSQNRRIADRLGVIAGLEAQDSGSSRVMAALVGERAP